ncbi:cation diffusion facilitator family transporter [Methanoregula sp. UBA64]|jgi:cobalt-zinc-cadmium efflux system protein|uniref:cation diffusion facilitator family transporter n=1 Tax=Methanoregula sp. UBA64 TaxID=1915554 RepID=UPI0025CB858C|nr:cation diffusion facilitator family transporter [Methanoregula sp. UBA64]
MDTHDHSRDHADDHAHKKPLKLAIALTATIFVAEMIGGLISGSLSLLGDAAHMLQDTVALFLSLGAMIVAERLPTPTKTFGYHRVEIAAAVINGLLLIGVSGIIIYEAIDRFAHPQAINSSVMLAVATVGLLANLASAYFLHGSHDLNVKSAFLHVLGDTLSSVAVIVAGIWIMLTGQTVVDPVLGIVIAIVILVSSFSILRDAFRILLQFAPKDVAVADVIAAMESVPGVSGVHNVHLWTLCSNINVLDAHVYCCESNPEVQETIKAEIRHRLEAFRIGHSTLEFECRECSDARVFRELKD